MRFLCTIFFDEKELDALSDKELMALQEATLACEATMQKSGHFVAAQALQPVQVATTVRLQSGKVSVTDGPFVETNEQIGGFFLIDADNLDEAIALASTIPPGRLGGIEVRPVKVQCGDRSQPAP
jgi:hypothetical protein